uniref:DNA2/NAM7 helicase-like C-terminal domain-containing protein n=1 Tax=Panagrolaimus superbus TaxID=310955 RepID=A0A914Y9T1_9BILA
MVCGTTAMIIRVAEAFSEKSTVLFVDEAGTVDQANVAAVLAQVGSIKKLVVVGDSRQLQVYNRGVPEVMLDMGHRSILSILQQNKSRGILQIAFQYTFRFYPLLVPLIAKTCYKGMVLKTNVTAEERKGFSGIFALHSQVPAFIINVTGGEEKSFPTSSKNSTQTNTVCSLVNGIRKRNTSFKIGVISLYNGQKDELYEAIKNKNNVKISSVDSFQGREADIIIIVTTRTSNTEENYFFNLEERITVAMTRVQRGVIIVGDLNAVQNAPGWRNIVNEFKDLNAIYKEIPFKCYASAAAKK